MHPRFDWQDRAAMRAFVADRPFGALFLATSEGPRVAYVPVVFVGDETIGFHLARSNALMPHLDGARALFVAQGPHGYVSPDWYAVDDQVPTWNYVAVEIEGVARRTDEAALLAIIDALSQAQEHRLAPKPAWTRDKMTPGLVEQMCKAIVGYTLEPAAWRGIRKLGQNKADEVRLRAADGMAAAGMADIAMLMRDA